MIAKAKKLLVYVGEYKKATILSLVFIILEVVMEVLIPFITADLVNRIKNGRGMDEVLLIGGAMVIAALFSLFFGSYAGINSARASAGFAKNLRRALFYKVQDFSFGNIDKFSTSSLVTRMTTDVTNIQNSFMMCIRIAIRSPMMLLFSVVAGFIMNPKLALTFVVIIPVLGTGLILIGRKAMPSFRAVFKKYDKLNESVEENVRGMRVVKGFSREEYETQKFSAASDNLRKDFTRAERIVAFNGPTMQLCMYFNMLFVLLIGSKMIVNSRGAEIDVGQLSAMITYGFQVLMAMMMISMIYVMLTMSVESLKRISEVLDEEPQITNPAEPVMEVKSGDIVFDNVSFRYSKEAKRDALSDINLNIRSGMTVGILGGTGSSKTTLIQLISRLYDVTSGSVKVGGVDVRDYDIETLRDAVSVVLQKNELFSGTIKDNLKWGNENATDEEIIEAAKLAQAHDFVMSFPDGYDSKIEQGGTNVSGGQKQRLCIARALLKHPKILILDDSTSAVDTRTDALIRKGFREYIPDTTKIIIAQRVASVEASDMIIIMEGGRVASVGTHDELMKTSDIYREIYEQQTKGGNGDEQ